LTSAECSGVGITSPLRVITDRLKVHGPCLAMPCASHKPCVAALQHLLYVASPHGQREPPVGKSHSSRGGSAAQRSAARPLWLALRCAGLLEWGGHDCSWRCRVRLRYRRASRCDPARTSRGWTGAAKPLRRKEWVRASLLPARQAHHLCKLRRRRKSAFRPALNSFNCAPFGQKAAAVGGGLP
jgi:hypothetical protein